MCGLVECYTIQRVRQYYAGTLLYASENTRDLVRMERCAQPQYIDDHLDPRLYTIQSATNSISHGPTPSVIQSAAQCEHYNNLGDCKQEPF